MHVTCSVLPSRQTDSLLLPLLYPLDAAGGGARCLAEHSLTAASGPPCSLSVRMYDQTGLFGPLLFGTLVLLCAPCFRAPGALVVVVAVDADGGSDSAPPPVSVACG